MVSYDKWDKLADSEDEDDLKTSAGAIKQSHLNEEREKRLELQEEISQWLRRQMTLLKKEESDPQRQSGAFGGGGMGGMGGMGGDMGGYGGMGGMGGGLGGMGGGMGSRPGYGMDAAARMACAKPKPLAPYRNITTEERKVLAMLIAVSDFSEGDTNLTRHPELLDLVRHHRWLEEDPGVQELMCRIHNAHMRRCGENKGQPESEEDWRMRGRLLCGINTIAAPKRAKCPGGLLDLFTQICTPETKVGRDNRKKWQMKEFAKDALFDSLFPDLRQYNDEDNKDESMWEIYLLLGLIVLIIIGIIGFVYYVGPLTGGKAAKNVTKAALKAAGGAAAAGNPEL